MRHARLALLAFSAVLALSACASEPRRLDLRPGSVEDAAARRRCLGAAPSASRPPATSVDHGGRGQVRRDLASTSRPTAAFKIDFDNQDAGDQHNMVIHKGDRPVPRSVQGRAVHRA